ncbi:MAG: hypothetical protein JSR58_01875 [Verrucomicrobia bacterium]|nr:hypothetical protein [Verrucomicrobiota bacterium]
MLLGLLSFLGTFCPLFAAAIQFYTLTSGVRVWVQESTEPPEMISLRVIEEGKKYGLDVFGQDAGEIDRFFTHVKAHATSSFDVIAVGDLEGKAFVSWMENKMQGLPAFLGKENPSQVRYKENSEGSLAEISLFYPLAVSPITSEETLKQFWCAVVFRQLFGKKLQASLDGSASEWDSSGDTFFFPQKSCGGRVKCFPSERLDVLTKLLIAVQEIKKEGFTIQEWNIAKAEMIKRVKATLRLPPDSAVLATYFSENVASGITYWPSYPFFVSSSVQVLKDLPRSMVHQIAKSVIVDKERLIEYSGAKISEGEIQNALMLYGADTFDLPVLEEQGNTSDEALAPYNAIPVTEAEEKLVWELIDKLGNKSIVGLTFAAFEMNRLGDKVRHIHPLRFLGYIFSDPYLKKCMKKAFEKTLVRNEFVKGLSEKFHKEFAQDNVYQLVPGFCKKTGADPDEVNSFIQAYQWQSLVEYLINL